MKYFIRWLAATIGCLLGVTLAAYMTGSFTMLIPFTTGCSVGFGACLYILSSEGKLK